MDPILHKNTDLDIILQQYNSIYPVWVIIFLFLFSSR